MRKYYVSFEKATHKKIKKAYRVEDLKTHISKAFEKIEEKGPFAGKLIDSKINIYEIKLKRPPLRIYYRILRDQSIARILDFEMKTSKEKQKKTIWKLKQKYKSLNKTKKRYLI